MALKGMPSKNSNSGPCNSDGPVTGYQLLFFYILVNLRLSIFIYSLLILQFIVMRKKLNPKEPIQQSSVKYQTDQQLFKYQYLHHSLNYSIADDMDMNLTFKFDDSIFKKIQEQSTQRLGLNFIQKVKLMKAPCTAGQIYNAQQYGQFINYEKEQYNNFEINAIDQQLKEEYQNNLLKKRIRKNFKIQGNLRDFQLKQYQKMLKDDILMNITDQNHKRQTNQQLQSSKLYRELFNIKEKAKNKDNQVKQLDRGTGKAKVIKSTKQRNSNINIYHAQRIIEVPKITLNPILKDQNAYKKTIDKNNDQPIKESLYKTNQQGEVGKIKLQQIEDKIKEQFQQQNISKSSRKHNKKRQIIEKIELDQIGEGNREIKNQIIKQSEHQNIKQSQKSKTKHISKKSKQQKRDSEKPKRSYNKKANSKENSVHLNLPDKDILPLQKRCSEIGIQFDMIKPPTVNIISEQTYKQCIKQEHEQIHDQLDKNQNQNQEAQVCRQNQQQGQNVKDGMVEQNAVVRQEVNINEMVEVEQIVPQGLHDIIDNQSNENEQQFEDRSNPN